MQRVGHVAVRYTPVHVEISIVSRGTDGSNPASSSGESDANLTFGAHPPMPPIINCSWAKPTTA
jgi:hypothetical protein